MHAPYRPLAGMFAAVIAVTLHAQKDYPIQPVPFTQVQVSDQFWAPKMQINATVTIPYTLEQCKKNGRMDNFLRAAGKLKDNRMTAFPFDDTDLYKAIEGACYSLQSRPDAKLERYLDTLISIIGDAQEPDGYLYTFRTMHSTHPHEWIGTQRWQNEEDLSHELYNAGHLYEAAVAHYQATGKRTLLNIALRNADLLVHDFGWGREEKFPGHQIVETGLTKLYRVTGKKEYLDLAKFFLDVRGPGSANSKVYNQANKKVTDQHEAEGHAVRAAYMYTGMADVAALTGDQEYVHAIDDIWNDVAEKKLYITGGIGATGSGEAFGNAYDLPNMSAYAETCASIANVYWNSRMFYLHGDSKYIDVLERTLYNGLLAGVSLGGNRFFYPNPLASMGQQRSAWFSCACCITNMTRFLPSMPGYIYAQDNNNVYVNLFVGGEVHLHLPAGDLRLTQSTRYPWEGKVVIGIEATPASAFSMRVRIPGWAKQEPVPGSSLYMQASLRTTTLTILLNGKPVSYSMEKGYAVITRTWKKGDALTLDLPMEVVRIKADAQVKDDRGKYALQRGPIVYCLEGVDHADSSVMNIVVSADAPVSAIYRPELLNGVEQFQMQGMATRRSGEGSLVTETPEQVVAIPYYAWANRGADQMEVWIAGTATAARPLPAPTIASKSRVSGSVSSRRMLAALNDQYDPGSSADPGAGYLHWWPKKATTEWVQYDFDSAYTISESKVYWFDDSPDGGCRVPAAWKLFYKKGEEWLPVTPTSPYGVTKDAYNTVHFTPVRTTALKMEVQLPAEFATGIHEWSVR